MGRYLLCISLVCIHSTSFAVSYQYYQTKIPNGDHVPHPCKRTTWLGVGHNSEGGGGVRNPFGEAFALQNHVWNADLCYADTDLDGRTNGEELGDPDCMWIGGEAPSRTTGITHPGVCEPVDNPDCQSRNLMTIDCDDEDVTRCPHLSGSEVVKHALRLMDTIVPAIETSYYCQTFSLPSDKVYYLKAAIPYIDNRNVTHRMIVYGCTPTADVQDISTPSSCEMRASDCKTILAKWSVGEDDGICYAHDIGLEVGQGVLEKVLIEVHWKNSQLKSTYRDHSGYNLYLTDQAPPKLASTLLIGQTELAIPPRVSSTTITSICTSDCTQNVLSESIYVIITEIHMHLLGKSGRIEVLRNGSKIFNIGETLTYDDNMVVTNTFMNAPVEIKPGDEIRMTCEFNSEERSETTFCGVTHKDEMCNGYIQYYSKVPYFDKCISTGNVDRCVAEKLSDVNPAMVGNCSYAQFMEKDYAVIEKGLLEKCGNCSIVCTKWWEMLYNETSFPECIADGMKFLYYRLESHKDVEPHKTERLIRGLESCNNDPNTAGISGGAIKMAKHSFVAEFLILIVFINA